MNYIVKPKKNLNGEFTVAPDKSISHRSIMIGAISVGETTVENFLTGEDCIATIDCFREMGVKIDLEKNKVLIVGKGINNLSKPNKSLYVGNSGTSIRLLSGILAGQKFETNISGDDSIEKRPMDRVVNPLRLMGGIISGKNNTSFAPLNIKPSKINGIDYTLPVASAQVKSAIIFASLYSDSPTIIREKQKSRNHTEIMLNYFGANITTKKDEATGENIIYSNPVKQLNAKNIFVPGDISSAAYFIVAGIICENSHLIIKNVGINQTRTGLIDALIKMGAHIKINNEREINGELIADIEVKSSKLSGITLSGDIIPRMIDEIPVFAVAALMATGTTIIKNAEELKVKESNRIKTVVGELKKLGGKIEETEDGMIIYGDNNLIGNQVESYNDHRIAMSMAIAAFVCSSPVEIKDCECIDISFPGFFNCLEKL